MVYDNIGHGADHCFPPPGYKRPKSMKRTDGVGPVGRRTNGRRTVCGKDVRAAASALCSQRLLLLRLFVRACVRAAASAVCGQAVRAAAAPVRACSCVGRVQSTPCCCSVCSCVQLRRPCARAAAASVRACSRVVRARAAASAVCSQPVLLRRPRGRAAASDVRAAAASVRACVALRRPCVRAAASALCSQHVLPCRTCELLLRPRVRAAASAVGSRAAASTVRSCLPLRRSRVQERRPCAVCPCVRW